MSHGERDVEEANLYIDKSQFKVRNAANYKPYDLRVALKGLKNRSTSEGLLTETGTNVGKDSSLCSIRLVEDVLERRVSGTEAVKEVLSEDPSRVGVGGLLDGELGSSVEEGVVGENV